ncbi:GNAT family N-acetyltransferase [Natrarchaeobius oligotrophus]|uniref:GNAT family N-acetyltransferase n=1 Tax=Natrarchaeobius chitinivorans TaxID=1679083 RepID=A0A3N6MQ65_NATCH|nr:GNAT family N-acetyltransferase [Natrarchaeobius chitinivorans]RQG99780.1 GNAT family N-acetyltransferase [Natrarchaeobius chitinivorans]
MNCELLGWPSDGPKLRLDHERFSYAGKFVMTNTGKAVARNADGDVVAAASFNEDRTDERTLWIRYVTVDRDRRGEGIGPELLALVRERALSRGYDRLRIAVNNPFAYEALYRTGFGYTGETTGIAELLLEYPPPLERGDRSEEASPGVTNADGDAGAVSNRDESDDDARRERYRAGLEEFRERELSDAEESFLESRRGRRPPETDTG